MRRKYVHANNMTEKRNVPRSDRKTTNPQRIKAKTVIKAAPTVPMEIKTFPAAPVEPVDVVEVPALELPDADPDRLTAAAAVPVDLLMLILVLVTIVELMLMVALLAVVAVALAAVVMTAARLMLDPPTVENVVHCEVDPAG